MLMVAYLEGIDSDRGIAWRCADSISLRGFLGYGLAENPPDHSSVSRTRRRLSLEAHEEVFTWVLRLVRDHGLLRGKTLGVDSSTLEANAAMRSIIRRDDGTGYREYLERLAVESGIASPTRAEIARLDRKRPKKGSNDDWEHPVDREARITRMKDGRTRLGHKLEHAVDMESGAVTALTVQSMKGGDTASLARTLDEAARQLGKVELEAEEVVADKSYHSNGTMKDLRSRGLRSYVSEPNRGRRSWKKDRAAQAPTYANRRRIKGARGLSLLRKRGELLERTFAHLLVTGAMRRVHLRGPENIRKRMLIQGGACNLGLLMRTLFRVGTPRGLQGLAAVQAALAQRNEASVSMHWRLTRICRQLRACLDRTLFSGHRDSPAAAWHRSERLAIANYGPPLQTTSATACSRGSSALQRRSTSSSPVSSFVDGRT